MITLVFFLCVLKAWRAQSALCSAFLFYLTSGVLVFFGKDWSNAAREGKSSHKVSVVSRCWGEGPNKGRGAEWGLTRQSHLLVGLQSRDSCTALWVCWWHCIVDLEMVTMVNVIALKASANVVPWEGGYCGDILFTIY